MNHGPGPDDPRHVSTCPDCAAYVRLRDLRRQETTR